MAHTGVPVDTRSPARRTLKTGPARVYPVDTGDGTSIRLTRYEAGSRGPVMLVHCIGVSSRMYSLDTVEINLLEYLVEREFDVWLLDYRFSIDLEASRRPSSFDEVARHDYPAAVNTILRETGAASIQVVAHGIGSQTFSMAILSGMEGVRSAVCSQVAAHLHAPWLNRLKAALRAPSVLRRCGIQTLSINPEQVGLKERLIDFSLRFHPVQKEERCDRAVCRRITGFYGPLYEHDQLNAETHAALGEQFGVFTMRAFSHLIRILNTGHLVDEKGGEAYLPNLRKFAIPVAFIHGTENDCLLPESTRESCRAFSQANGDALYSWHGIPGYGHVDCMIGAHASRDVYPIIADHLEACPA